jgi:hypothetical protein
MYDEMRKLTAKVESLEKENRQIAIFSLQTSFECKDYEDIPSKEILCPICENIIEITNENIVFSRNFWDTGIIKRIKCSSCNLIFGPLSVINKDSKRLSEDYKMLYSYYKEGETSIYQKMAFEALNGLKNKKYLNYACGTWKDGISELLKLGWDIYGFEPNLPLQHENIKVNVDDLADIEFDGLFTHNFIEHIQNPIKMFTTWNKMLKVGDIMVHSSACFKWKFDFSNFHIFFFLGESLDILAKRTGFKVIGYIEHEPENDYKYTRIVSFKKINDIDENLFIESKHNKMEFETLDNSIVSNKLDYNLLNQENIFLKKRVEELTNLYTDILNSKTCRITNKIKKMIGR